MFARLTFLSYEPFCGLEVPYAGALVFGVVGTFPGVSEHLRKGNFQMLIHSFQVEIPETKEYN